MEQQYCLNLCDIGLHPQMSSDSEYKRIYIGSYFCSRYFIQMKNSEIKDILKFCKDSVVKVTLVIPTFSERDLATGIKRIHDIKDLLGDVLDEFTVNDFGMMVYLKKTYGMNLNMGRLFMKDYRDPRYPEYFKMPCKPKIFHSYLVEWMKEYQITGVEFDPTHEVIDLSSAPENLIIGVHKPYCYITMGRICQYASMGKEIDQKFRPNMDCQTECKTNRIRYNIGDDRDWIRVGRAIYFKNESAKFINGNIDRVIYFPIDEEVKQ